MKAIFINVCFGNKSNRKEKLIYYIFLLNLIF